MKRLLLLSTILLAQSAWGATYYVDKRCAYNVPCCQKMDWKKFVHKLWFNGEVKKGN